MAVGISLDQVLREDPLEGGMFEQKCKWSEGVNEAMCLSGMGRGWQGGEDTAHAKALAG